MRNEPKLTNEEAFQRIMANKEKFTVYIDNDEVTACDEDGENSIEFPDFGESLIAFLFEKLGIKADRV